MEAKKPLLSIIIPTYNEEGYLPALLTSIAGQTYRDIENIVADAHSTDGTRAVAERFGARVVTGGLPAVGRNNGAREARGKYFLFFDADVVLPDPRFVEDTMREFIERELDIATCQIRAMDGTAYDKFFYGVYNIYTLALERILPHVPGFCVYIKRSVHEAIDGFDEEIKLAEDHDYARRGAKIGRFGFLTSRYIPVSTRRFDRDGRISTATKYVLSELHMLTVGPITTDIFKYGWGHDKKLQDTKDKT